MKNINSSTILAFLASVCFFVSYFFKGRDTLYLILGIAWLIISIGYYTKNLKKKEKNNKNGRL